MSFERLARRRMLRLIVAAALIVSAYVVAPIAVPGMATRAAADQPVSGAFTLGGGVGGSIDPRTGMFSVSMPLVNVASRGGSGVTMTLGWDQARAGSSVDRYGWGAGWSLGTTFVDPSGGTTVYPADGGAYAFDGQFDSRLENYVLEDLVYAIADGTLPAVAGVHPALDYASTLTYDDGRVDYFDSDGNFVSRVDRFGNRTDLTYSSAGVNQWQPATIVDAYGLTTTFDYGTDDDGQGTVTVSAPSRADGVVASTVVTFDADGRVQRLTDPNGNEAAVTYTSVPTANEEYVQTVTGPSGAQTGVTYQVVQYANDPNPLTAVNTLDVTDLDGNKLMATRTFDMDPEENGPEQHNYAGYPEYLSSTEDLLFERADPDYRYTTEISNGASGTLSTYDSEHRLVARTVTAQNDAGDVIVQRHAMTYPGFFPPQALPGNYARPLTTQVQFLSKSGPGGMQTKGSARTVQSSQTYDMHGRVKTSTDELGTTTTTTYDPTFGLVTSSVAVAKDGTQRSVTNALNAAKTAILSTTQAEAGTGEALSARTVIGYAYDGFGELTSRTATWAADAAPPDNGGGPASSTTSFDVTIDAARRTRTVKLTAGAGTTAARTTTTTIDLVSGQPLQTADALGRTTSRRYDAGGRIVALTPPTGLTTKTSYAPADQDTGDPAIRTVTEADGHVTQTTYDELGRTTEVTDNVRNGAFVSGAAGATARTVAKTTYDYLTNLVTSTDRAGRTTTTTSDALGRPVQQVGPTGITRQITYDDTANSILTAVLGENAAAAGQYTTDTYDALSRHVSSQTTYPVPNRGRPQFLSDPVDQVSYDGIGRPTRFVSEDRVGVPDYSGPGGFPTTTVVGPTSGAPNPGSPITATDVDTLDGRTSVRTLQQAGQPDREGSSVTYDAAGNINSVGDALGRKTVYTYAGDGQVKTRTSPSGIVTTNAYEPTTGRLSIVTARAVDGTTTKTSYAYVPTGKVGAGLIASMTNESGTVTYSYDADRNPTGVTYPNGSTITSDFTDQGELRTSTDITGAVTTYAYFDDSSLKSATQVRAGTTLASVAYTYDGLGRVRTVTRGNGLITTNSYTPNHLLQTQTTLDKTGKQVESHSYAYDTHHNLTTRTDTTAKPGGCPAPCNPGPSTYGTWTTSYQYDAYDRLVGSSVYTGSQATGTPTTTLVYALDLSGNVTKTTRTTRAGSSPVVTTTTSNAIDDAGQLTSATTGTSTVQQTFDPDGRVKKSLDGSTTTYRPDGLPATVTKNGTTTEFSYWPDGSRRRAASTTGTTSSTTDLYYRADGALVNDTGTRVGGSSTASYLLTAGREARTTRPGANASAATTTGKGVGYFLRDRHSSVTAVVDSTGAVTNTYAYGDYGAPALLDGRAGAVTGAAPGAAAGQTNPFTYAGAAVRGMYTDAGIGTLMTPTRVYDPAQGRFTSRDPANLHNRYVGFNSNPIMHLDLTGQTPLLDIILDALFAVVFAVAAVATGGAAAAAGVEVFAAVEAGTEVAATVATTAIANSVATVAGITGAVSNGLKLADDVDDSVTGKHFLTDSERGALNTTATVAGAVAFAGGIATAGATVAGALAEGAEGAGAAAAGDVATDADAFGAGPAANPGAPPADPASLVSSPEPLPYETPDIAIEKKTMWSVGNGPQVKPGQLNADGGLNQPAAINNGVDPVVKAPSNGVNLADQEVVVEQPPTKGPFAKANDPMKQLEQPKGPKLNAKVKVGNDLPDNWITKKTEYDFGFKVAKPVEIGAPVPKELYASDFPDDLIEKKTDIGY